MMTIQTQLGYDELISLFKIVNNLSGNIYGVHDLVEVWKSLFNTSVLNKPIIFYDSKDNDFYYETFDLVYDISNYGLIINIWFDISRINKFIKSGNINPVIVPYQEIADKYHKSKTEEQTSYKKGNPIIVFFPLNSNGSHKHFAVIDGNHRLDELLKKGNSFNFSYIDKNCLTFDCFCSLSSWAKYHFLTDYYLITNKMVNVDKYLDLLKTSFRFYSMQIQSFS